MAAVTVEPMPASLRAMTRYRHRPPPVFTDGEPTPSDIELARELFRALDPESQRWYGFFGVFAGLDKE